MKRMFILIVISLISISSASSFADATQENITLSRISNILNAVYPLIYKAQKESDKNTRIKFQYAWLKKDIKKIKGYGTKDNIITIYKILQKISLIFRIFLNNLNFLLCFSQFFPQFPNPLYSLNHLRSILRI